MVGRRSTEPHSTISGGTFAVNMVDVADDGSIYACNLSTSPSSPFKVYRWSDEASGLTTPPTEAYNNVSGTDRTGDAFAVQGGAGGAAVQFAAAGSNATNASNFVIGTTDASNVSTAFLSVPGTGTSANDYRLSLSFVDANTVIGNQGGLARMTVFDTSTVTATVVASIGLGGTAQRPLDYAVIGNTPVLACIDTNSATVSVFSLLDPANPVLLATANNTTGTLSANANGVGSVQWGDITGQSATLYAMSTNQGIQAFTVDLSPIAASNPIGTGCDGMVLGANGAPTLGNAGYELSVSGVPAVSPVAFVGFGSVLINPGTDLTAVGMAGCFGYTNLDFGIYQTSALSGGVGTFGLAVPNNPALAGGALSAQALAFSTTTVLQLAASNGLEIAFGF